MGTDTQKSCCECRSTDDVCYIQMKIPGTANTYSRKDKRYVCKRCRKKREYRSRFRILWGEVKRVRP